MPGTGIEAGAVVVPRTTPVWVGRDGSKEPLPVRADDYTMARVSPDGRRVALVTGSPVLGRAPAIWLFDLDTQNLSLLVTDVPADSPVWAPNSRRLFYRRLGEAFEMGAIDVDTGEATIVAGMDPAYDALPPNPWILSPDERGLLMIQARSNDDVDSTVLDLDSRTYRVLLQGPGNQIVGDLSRDGAWLSYFETPPGGASEVRIVPYPDVSRRRIPVGPGGYSTFSRDGRELFFHDGNGISVVPVEYEPTFRIGTPSRAVEGDYMWVQPGRSWDVSPDGRRFLLIPTPQIVAGEGEAGAPVTPQIDVVLNWVEELKARVGRAP